MGGTDAGAGANRFLIQPKKPGSAAAGAAATGAGRCAERATLGAGLVGSGLGMAAGAGASGNTPLMIGICLLVGSCERRVTAVGSSLCSAIL